MFESTQGSSSSQTMAQFVSKCLHYIRLAVQYENVWALSRNTSLHHHLLQKTTTEWPMAEVRPYDVYVPSDNQSDLTHYNIQ